MARYSVQPRNRLVVNVYGFLSSVKKYGENIGKTISKNVSSKYSQKLLDHAKQSATDAIQTAIQKRIQKTAEATSDLICNKIANEITNVSRTSPQYTSETERVESEPEISTQTHISPKKDGKLLMISD